MYCVKCGVELADSQRVCPLCGTRVFHPDIPRTPADPPYPPDERVHPEEVNRSGVCFILTALALLVYLLMNRRMGFATGASTGVSSGPAMPPAASCCCMC